MSRTRSTARPCPAPTCTPTPRACPSSDPTSTTPISTHNLALEDGSIRWAGRNAHGLRKFREAVESDPVLGAEGERWIASWFDQERVGRERGLVGAELLAWRQEHIAPLASGFLRWLALVHPTVLPRSPMPEATRYYANYWRPLTAFLRAQAVRRANWLFAGSDEDDANTAVAYTLVQTATLHGLDPLAYLTWVLGRVARCRDGGGLYRDPTPAMYQEAQQRERGRRDTVHPSDVARRTGEGPP